MPNDKLRYQVIAVGQNLRPLTFSEIQIEIFDERKNLVSSVSTSQGIRKSFGFYEGEFQIDNETKLEIKIHIESLNLMATKEVNVNHNPAPLYKLYIETKSPISFQQRVLNFFIYAKYSVNNFVKGSAKIIATVRRESNSSTVLGRHKRTVPVNNDKSLVSIGFKNDLSLNYLQKNVIIDLIVEFEEKNTGAKVREFEKIILTPDAKHVINIESKEQFVPGHAFKIKASVTTLDGLPEQSTKIPLSMKIKYNYERNPSTEISMLSFLKQGSTQYVLNPPKEAVSVEATLEFDKTKKYEVFYKAEHSTPEEYLKASFITEKLEIFRKLRHVEAIQ